MSQTLKLTQELVSIPSITPDDKGCQEILIKRLESIGFIVERLKFGKVDNFWARRGTQSPLLVFAGHTDIVPVGDELDWDNPPFLPTIKDNQLYGRGTADMKGNIAAFIVAVEAFVASNPHHSGSIGFLITSDEEGVAVDGTVKVMDWLNTKGIKIDYCLVGEPSSGKQVGDTIKNGRRGSLNGNLTVYGKQGHIAYPHLASNPIHLISQVLDKLVQHQWDKGNNYFPPTSFQISNIHSGTGVTNVIPNTIEIVFNFRYSTEQTYEKLKGFIENILDEAGLNYHLNWQHSGKPFLTKIGQFTDACIKAIKSVNGIDSQLSTTGGTSDGRFIAPSGAEVVELGVLNQTIHQVNEHIGIDDLECITHIYQAILTNILIKKS